MCPEQSGPVPSFCGQPGTQRFFVRLVDRLFCRAEGERRLGGEFFGQLSDVLVELVALDEFADETDILGFLGTESLAEEDHPPGGLVGDESRESLCPAPTRDDSQVDLGLSDDTVLTGDTEVTGECEFTPTAERVAVQCGDHWCRDRLQPAGHVVPEFCVGLCLGGREVLHIADVCAGDEGVVSGPGEYHCASVGVSYLLDPVSECFERLDVQRVQSIRSGDCECGDGSVVVELDGDGVGVWHRGSIRCESKYVSRNRSSVSEETDGSCDGKVSFKSGPAEVTDMEPNPGDRVSVDRAGVTNEGVLMPSTDEAQFVVKLDGGYNVGIDRADAAVEVLETDAYDIDENGVTEGERSEIDFDDDLPRIALISTGGTIASTVDYRTGAVTARFDAEDVLRAVPDLAGRANYCGRVVANILSENMEPPIWQDLAEAVADEIERGADGVVVMHGTDTMQFSAAALSFMLDTPVPVVFTGSQRSADRPSSDNVVNAVCSVEAAKSDCAEVLVCMHEDETDDGCALHRGTRVRKNHTSRRDAFETVGGQPLGRVDYEPDEVSVELREDVDYQSRGEVELATQTDIASEVELLKFTPGMDPAAFDYLADKDGVVIEGTGLGHVHTDLIPTVEDLVDGGTQVVMTSQCLTGRVCDRVYDTGRDLLDAGVTEAGDTLPGTAKVKLMWALANCEDDEAVRETMETDLAGELTEESQPWR